MTGRFKSLIGEKFEHWTVISQHESVKGNARWLCRCICGNEEVLRTNYLTSGKYKSCGCKNQVVTHGHTRVKISPTYSSWSNMISRCTQPSSPAFKHYQKRGITVCERWREFINFLADMGERPSKEHTLDRWPNNDGNYQPGNVRWATKREQANNRITNVKFEYRGETFTLAELARHTGVKKDVLRERLCRSRLPWTVEGAVNTPVEPGKRGVYGFYC